jgi:spore maturation protein B
MIVKLMGLISTWTIPVILLGLPLYGQYKGVKVYEAFIEGAKEGYQTAVRIIPYLIAMFVAIRIFQDSGALQLFLAPLLRPIVRFMQIPTEVVPLAIVRTLSGSGAYALLSELLRKFGPDSFTGSLASIMQGSTETTFYVLTVYFGAVGVKATRHTLSVSLLADLAGFLAAVVVTHLLFSTQ